MKNDYTNSINVLLRLTSNHTLQWKSNCFYLLQTYLLFEPSYHDSFFLFFYATHVGLSQKMYCDNRSSVKIYMCVCVCEKGLILDYEQQITCT